MTIIVCGGRHYNDRGMVFDALDVMRAKLPFGRLCHGGATGADALAGEWARARGVREVVYRAEWSRYGRSAGPRRNVRMLQESGADALVAFPGGTGTAHMLGLARDAGLFVWEPCKAVGG